MSTTPLSGTILAHFFTKDEKINFFKSSFSKVISLSILDNIQISTKTVNKDKKIKK